MSKISVIVPVYRVERYLPVCLDSIRSQTMEDIEIVCVNDGSPDRSRSILASYAEIDSRIVIVDKKNGGLSSARNAGIRAASAEIVCFVDSDDLLEKDACQKIYDSFKMYKCDVVTFGGSVFPSHRSNAWLDDCLSPRDAVYDHFDPDLIFKEKTHPFVWRTALRRDFLLRNDLWFDEDIRFGEDELFHYSVYPRANRTVLISNKLYCYRVNREESLMATRSCDTFLKAYDHLRIVERIARDWHGLGIVDLCSNELLHQFAEFLLRDVLNSRSDTRMILLRYARAIFETYFTREQLSSLLSDSLYGGMARAVLVDGSLAWRGKRKRILYRHTFATDPMEFLRAACRRFWQIGLFRRAKSAVLERLPLSARRQKFIADETLWSVREINDFVASKTLLDFEMLRRD